MRALPWIAVASFAYVFLRAFQQLNVVHGAYVLVLLTSYGMAVGDIFLITNYAQHGFSWPLVLTVGSSSGSGAVAAMWLRKQFFSVRV